MYAPKCFIPGWVYSSRLPLIPLMFARVIELTTTG